MYCLLVVDVVSVVMRLLCVWLISLRLLGGMCGVLGVGMRIFCMGWDVDWS